MLILRIAAGAALLALVGTACVPARIVLLEQDSGVEVRLRGISATSDQVAWASGAEGTVLRTVDGGLHWQLIQVPGAAGLDFRDIEGFDADRAVVLSIGPGEASRVYRTGDGGRSWTLRLQNRDPDGFLDCMAFDGVHGVILGDPVDGRFQLHETRDGGEHWTLRSDGPHAAAGEAAFAASGTCIALSDGDIVFVTGGSQARAHYLSHPGDGGARRWRATPAADTPPLPSAGYFSVAPTPRGFIAVGGDCEQPEAGGVAATLPAADASGSVAAKFGYEPQSGPAGYRSGIACMDEASACVATGPSGTDWWDDGQWTAVSPLGFDAIDLAGNTGWVSGDAGRIARIEVNAGNAPAPNATPAEARQVSGN